MNGPACPLPPGRGAAPAPPLMLRSEAGPSGPAKRKKGDDMRSCIRTPTLVITLLAAVAGGPALADGVVPAAKRTEAGLYLTAAEAGTLRATRPDALLIDIRTRAEVAFVGIAEGVDKNIPYMVVDDFWEFDAEKGTYKLVVNPDFTAALDAFVTSLGLGKDATIILMCRSGSRSARAADLLGRLGYSAVYSVIDGFEGDKGASGARDVNGWKNAGLGWTYRVSPAVSYQPSAF